jgi:hypothetical protein
MAVFLRVKAMTADPDVHALRRGLLLAAAALLLAGCVSAAHEEKKPEIQLAQITRWLPGSYTNLAQHDADVRSGKQPHEALAISIVPIDSPIMGLNTFYLQESAADDPQRIMRQQVLTFEVNERGRLREQVANLVDPRRWRDGPQNPELLTALVTEDLAPLGGCDLFWQQSGDGGFVGLNDPARCHVPTHTAESAATTQLVAELKSTELDLSEQSYDASGALLEGRRDDPLYRFHKGSTAPKP